MLAAILGSVRGERDAIIPVGLAQRMVPPVGAQSALGVIVRSKTTIFHDGRNFGFDSTMAADLKSGQIRAIVTNRNGALEGVSQASLSDCPGATACCLTHRQTSNRCVL